MTRLPVFAMASSLAALMSLVSLAAQSNSPQQSVASDSTRDPGSREMTVIGCLKSTDILAVERSGSSLATGPLSDSIEPPSLRQPAASAPKFMLTNAEVTSREPVASGGNAAPPSNVQSGMASSSTHSSFQLIASPDIDLTPHVNHKVEVKGTAEPNLFSDHLNSVNPRAPDTPGVTGKPNPGATPSFINAAPRLRVTGLKMLSGTCS